MDVYAFCARLIASTQKPGQYTAAIV